MRPRHLIAIAVLLLFVVLAGVWVLTREDDSPGVSVEPNPDQVSRDIARTPDADSEDKTGGARRQPARPASPQDGPDDTEPEGERVSVTGRVIDRETREPLPGTEIQLVLPGETDESLAVTAADEEGLFAFAIDRLPGGALIRIEREGYRSLEEPASQQPMTLELLPGAWIEVSFEDTSCVPARAHFTWGDENRRSGRFDDSSQTLRIGPMYVDEPLTGKVSVVWIDELIEREAVTISAGEVTRVTMRPPGGGSIHVRIIGPDGRPLKGAGVRVNGTDVEDLYGRTGDTGECAFAGIPADVKLLVRLRYAADGVFKSSIETVTLEFEGDRKDVLYDLTGTGVVECRMTIDGEPISSLTATELRTELRDRRSSLVLFSNAAGEGPTHRVHGLKPGRYRVTGKKHNPEIEFNVELDVLEYPAISTWEHAFQTRTVTVTQRGAPEDAKLVLEYLVWHHGPGYPRYDPEEDGKWILSGLGESGFNVVLWGDGYASKVVRISPVETDRVEIPVVKAGTLRITGADEITRIKIYSFDPPHFERRFTVFHGELEVLLPPGRYSVSGGRLWKGETVTLSAGRLTECVVDPISTIEFYTRDGSSTLEHSVSLHRGDERVLISSLYTVRNGRRLMVARFEGEGTYTLKIKRPGYKSLETTVEVTPGEPIEFEIALEPKDD